MLLITSYLVLRFTAKLLGELWLDGAASH